MVLFSRKQDYIRMRIKRLYYDKSDTLVVTYVLFTEDLKVVSNVAPRYLEVAKADDSLVNSLHSLIMISNLLEKHKDERQAIRQAQIESQVSGV